MKKLSPFVAMVISMTFTVIVTCVVLIHVHENTIVSPNQEQVSVEETPIIHQQQNVSLNKTDILENFRFRDAATVPVKIKVQYDSTDPMNRLREINLRSSIIKECHKWTLIDFLTHPTFLHDNLLEHAQWFRSQKFIVEVDFSYDTSDPNKYIDENFSKETATFLKKELKDNLKDSKEVTKEKLDAAIAKMWEDNSKNR